jgi:hypothetical protein
MMKRIKTFESFVNEATGKKVTAADIKRMTGMKAVEDEDFEFDPDEGYTSVQSFLLINPKIGEDYPLFINIYDGDKFSFFQDAAPRALSIHTQDEKRSIGATLIEVPLPLSKLTKSIVDEVVQQAANY